MLFLSGRIESEGTLAEISHVQFASLHLQVYPVNPEVSMDSTSRLLPQGS